MGRARNKTAGHEPAHGVAVKRLGKKRGPAKAGHRVAECLIADAAHDDDRGLGRRLAELRQQVEAMPFRHREVAENHLVMSLVDLLERGYRIIAGHHRQSGQTEVQHVAEGLQQRGIIVNDQQRSMFSW